MREKLFQMIDLFLGLFKWLNLIYLPKPPRMVWLLLMTLS